VHCGELGGKVTERDLQQGGHVESTQACHDF
jgi:hypothetical protein